jgi:tetratricopeptide (TPR) repeat protein
MESWMTRPFVVLRQPLTSANADQNSDCNQVNEIDREIADLTKAIALNPEDAWAIFFRGMDYEAKGEFDRAIADYDNLVAIADFHRALEIKPSNQGAINNLKALGVTP